MSIPKTFSPGFLALVNDAKSRVKQMDAPQYKQLKEKDALSGHTLIDTREDHEWAESHAEGAVHLSKGILERDIETAVPDKQTTIVLYCGGGYRSALAADSLQKMGYTNAISLDGGWRGWQEAGLPVVVPGDKK